MSMGKLGVIVIAFIGLELAALVIVYFVCWILSIIGLEHWIFPFWVLGVPCVLLAAAVLAAWFATRLR
jgi:hypothetical protein